MKRFLSVAAFGAVLVACGGGGGGGSSTTNPDSVKFNYGTYGTASGTALTAATAGEGGASDALALSAAADDTHTESLVNLPDIMAGAVFTDTMAGPVQGMAASARQAMSGRAAAYAAGDLVTATTGFIDPACVVVAPTSVTYNHCTLTETQTDGTMTLTVDGTLTRGLTSVDWNVTVIMDMTVTDPNGNITARVGSHLTGHVGVSEVSGGLWNVAGFARSENSASASGQGQSVSMAFTHNADLDLDYLPGFSCVTDGTVELKRVWSQRPSGGTATNLPNVGVMFQWSGGSAPSTCASSVQVSWGVLQ